MNILAIDPSIRNVGFAFFQTENPKLTQDRFLSTYLHHPLEIKRGNHLRMQAIGQDILQFLHLRVLQGKKINRLVIEYPQWENSQRGAIASEQGYTLDLAYICGLIVAYSNLPSSSSVLLPTPLIWKGNLPKKATESRVQQKFGTLQISEHEYDACGLLLWGCEKWGLAI